MAPFVLPSTVQPKNDEQKLMAVIRKAFIVVDGVGRNIKSFTVKYNGINIWFSETGGTSRCRFHSESQQSRLEIWRPQNPLETCLLVKYKRVFLSVLPLKIWLVVVERSLLPFTFVSPYLWHESGRKIHSLSLSSSINVLIPKFSVIGVSVKELGLVFKSGAWAIINGRDQFFGKWNGRSTGFERWIGGRNKGKGRHGVIVITQVIGLQTQGTISIMRKVRVHFMKIDRISRTRPFHHCLPGRRIKEVYAKRRYNVLHLVLCVVRFRFVFVVK